MNFRDYFFNFYQMISKNLLIKGTLILTITGFLSRILGFYNRIFLSELIGAKELGIYQLILPIYMLAYAITTHGNEIALTKLVSEYIERKDFSSANSFFKLSFVINFIISSIIACLIYMNAEWICIHLLKIENSSNIMKTICFCVPFMAVKGSLHGFFLGCKKTSLHGISDLIEQSFKIISLYCIASYSSIHFNLNANFASYGILIGEIISFIFSYVSYIVLKNKLLKKYNLNQSITLHKLITLFFCDAIPLTLNKVSITLLQSIEAILIPSLLFIYYHDSDKSLSIYGLFTGIAFPFILFPATITNALSTILLPTVSSAYTMLNHNYLRNICKKSIQFCILLGLFSLFTYYYFGTSIGSNILHSRETGQYLYMLSVLCPFIYLTSTLTNILNGIGFSSYNLFITFISSIIRIGSMIILIPNKGINGYVIGLWISYFLLIFISINKIKKYIKINISIKRNIIFPFIYLFILIKIIMIIFNQISNHFIQNTPLTIIFIILYGILGIMPFIFQILIVSENE